jgi:hypothetical protein
MSFVREYNQRINDARTRTERELLTLLPILQKHGIKSVTAEYRGGGDSGDVEDITWEFDEDSVDLATLGPDHQYLKSITIDWSVKGWSSTDNEWTETKQQRDLETIIADLSFTLVGLHSPGWENNEGGEGHVVFTAHRTHIEVEVEHGSHYLETSWDSEHLIVEAEDAEA